MDQKPRILIVDDDEGLRILLKRALSKSDYDITEAASGEAALAILKSEELFDVMLLDVRMPKMDGLEVLNILRDDPKLVNTKVIMLSSLTDTGNKIRAFSDGASDYVIKPFVKDELIARVGALIKVKQAEKALKRQEEKYRTIFENSAVAITVTDEQERIISWNSLAEDLLGMNRDDLYLKPIKSLYSEEEWKRIRAQNIRQKGMEHHMETQVIKKNQEVIDVDISISVLKDPDGEVTGSIGVLSDITERKQVQEELKRKEEYFRALTEYSVDAIMSLGIDGSIQYESPSITNITGYTPEERKGKSVFDLIHPEDIQKAWTTFDQLKNNDRTSIHAKFRIQHKDGSWHDIDAIGNNLLNNPTIAGIIINLRDVTEQKKMEEQIRLAEEKYRTIFQNSAIAITVTDEQERIISWNSLAEDLLGMNRDDLYLKPIKSLYSEEEWKRIRAQNIRQKGMKHHMETQVIKKNQEVIDVDISISVLKDPDGEITGSIGVLSDITERKQVQEELKRKEEYFRALIEDSSDAVVVISSDGTISYESPSMERMLGLKPEDRIDRHPFEYVHPDDMDKATKGFSQLLEKHGAILNEEIRVFHKDGSMRVLETTAKNLLDNPVVNGIVANFRDITERRTIATELEESELKYSAVVEQAQDGVIIVQDKVFKFVNQAMSDISGYSAEELLGTNYLDVAAPGYTEIASITDKSPIFGKDGTSIFDSKLLCKDGTTKEIEVSSSVIQYEGRSANMGLVRDITERKTMENELRESEARLHSYLDNSPDVICAVNLQGDITFINEAAERVTGYTREELTGKNFIEVGLLAPSNSQKPTQWMKNRGAEKHIGADEMEIIKKDGTHRFIEVSTFPMFSADGSETTEIVSIIRDVSDRNTMENQLLLAGRLAAVGELAAGVAHELNNPLAAIQGYSQFLARKTDLDEAIKDDVETIYKEAQRATKITANLLAFARKHEPEKKRAFLNDAINQSVELNAYRMKVNNVEIETELDPDLPMTLADFHQLQQVFVNIMNNAEHVMTETHGRGKLIIKSESIDNIIRISFIDDGPGIPETDIKRIFDPFYTTKDVGKGTGLGLSICFGIVDSHNGSMYAKNNEDQGTTFIIEIPVTSEDQVAEEQTQGQTA